MSAGHEKRLFPMTKPDIPLTASRITIDGQAAALSNSAALPTPAMNSHRRIRYLPH
jgi:hypothetical protein